MTAFVESCVQTVAGSAGAVQRLTRRNPRAAKLLKALANKKKILVTTHLHPDPDALGSSYALYTLLTQKLKDAEVHLSVKGEITGGLNAAFTRYTNMSLTPWDDAALATYDAVVLLDSQPAFAYSPLPPDMVPTAVIDHHPSLGHRLQCAFCDVRTDVGATSSIIFNYFMELEMGIDPDLSATLLYAIETDLAGAARQPAKLDAIALSSLTLTADMRKLYEMRYVDLPRAYYIAYAQALLSAEVYDNLIVAHLDRIDSLEKPAVIADFLLRYDQATWCLVTAVNGQKLVMSLRTTDAKQSAGHRMGRIMRQLGYGGGHRSKAGGYIDLKSETPAEIERTRRTVVARLLRCLKIPASHGQSLVRLKAEE
ncbi:MAG: DHH family phosphoesterase [Phycisphaerae bacterium]|nr:DHH family phosphoesterase [Phycisphaerae bacterium]